MTRRRDELLHEVGSLPDPLLPAARAQQIGELARARFLASARAPDALPRRARVRVPEIAAAALLSACIAAYLTWTAVTVASLQSNSQSVLFERAAGR